MLTTKKVGIASLLACKIYLQHGSEEFRSFHKTFSQFLRLRICNYHLKTYNYFKYHFVTSYYIISCFVSIGEWWLGVCRGRYKQFISKTGFWSAFNLLWHPWRFISGNISCTVSHHATFYWVRFPQFPAYGEMDTVALQYLLRLKDGWE